MHFGAAALHLSIIHTCLPVCSAAWRALESLEPPGSRLCFDPLAAALAGAGAVHEALQLAQPWPSEGSSDGGTTADFDGSRIGDAAASAPSAPGQQLRRRFCFSNVASRVWWFDSQLVAALATPAPAGPSPPPRQVVVLGGGLDSRPWRLAGLPRGVRWFEVDLPQVAEAKRQQLEQLSAARGASRGAAGAHPAALRIILSAAS